MGVAPLYNLCKKLVKEGKIQCFRSHFTIVED